MRNKCPKCGGCHFDTLQMRRGKAVVMDGTYILGSESKKGRTVEIKCSDCGIVLDNSFRPLDKFYKVKDGKYITTTIPGGEYDYITQSKDELITYLLKANKEA